MLIELTKKTQRADCAGFYWTIQIMGKKRSDDMRYLTSHIEIKDKGDVSQIAATCGGAILLYETITRYESGCYNVDKCTKTQILLSKDAELSEGLFPLYDQIFQTDHAWKGHLHNVDAILSHGFIAIVRQLNDNIGLDFELYRLAMAHGQDAEGKLPTKDGKTALEISTENYRALIMCTRK